MSVVLNGTIGDSEDDFHTGCRNASHCHQQSTSGLLSMLRSDWLTTTRLYVIAY